jgi:major outer membrane protein
MGFLFRKMVLCWLVCISMASAYALPLGNPADPGLYSRGLFFDDCYGYDTCFNPCDPCGCNWLDSLSFRFGYYGDFVYNRHLERDESDDEGDFEHARFYTNAALLVLNFCDRLDLFGTFGATTGAIETQSSTTLTRLELEFASSFSWSLGARAILWECGCTYLGIEGQYFRTSMDLKRLTLAAETSSYPSGVEMRHTEWQLGLGLAQRLNFLIPYVGVKWSRVRGDFDGEIIIIAPPGITPPDTKNKNHWGFVAGVTLLDCELAGVTVEGRWGDEKALHVNGQIRF